ncbi:MAG: hypothetical protein ABSF67_07400 [Roseiarcus sp.]
MKSLALLPRALPLALALSAASMVGACSSFDGIYPTSWSPRQGAQQDKRDTPDSEKAARLPLSAEELQCPPVEIDEGGAAARVGGADNASVRYQFDISQTARECAPLSDNQFSLKVGVSGRLLIGPAGKPGAYSAPLRVTVHDENTKKDAFTKVYKVEASVPDAGDAPFSLVTEPIVLPMTRTELADDYTLTVGFDNGKAAASPAPKPKKPHPKPKKTDAPN